MVLLELFWIFFQVTLFSFGGGYAALPIIKDIVVDRCGWLTITRFADLVVIDEMTPGPIILNSATFIGAQIAGLPGAIMATIGCIISPAIIVSIIAYYYFKYKELSIVKAILSMLRPAVAALIASAGISIILPTFFGEGGMSAGTTSLIAIGIFTAAIIVLRKWKVNPALVMLGCGALGGILFSIM